MTGAGAHPARYGGTIQGWRYQGPPPNECSEVMEFAHGPPRPPIIGYNGAPVTDWICEESPGTSPTDTNPFLLRTEGTACFKALDWPGAARKYRAALLAAFKMPPASVFGGMHSEIHLYSSNYVATLLKLPPTKTRLECACTFAEQCITDAPSWAKSHYRYGQVLEAQGQIARARAAYQAAAARGPGGSRATAQMVQAVVRCGGSVDSAKIQLASEESLMQELLDVKDKRILKQRAAWKLEGRPLGNLPKLDDTRAGTRQDQKLMMLKMSTDVMQQSDNGCYRDTIERAVQCAQLACILGETPTICSMLSQLAIAYTNLRQFKIAAAYARNALAITGVCKDQ